MENRKFVKFIIPFFILGFFTFNINPVFAYWIDTHALLTKDAVEFYSEKVATSSVNNFIDYLIDGARKEDDVPRWMNHFYDPVYDRGLTMDSKIDPFYVLGNWNKSKDWVVGSDLQNEMKYKVPTTVASILTAIQQGKISSLTTETDFTWNEALYFWINGEKEKSMFALGHILHLIQDVSVPDHTRNDPHPEGSIYEKWTSQFSLNNPDNKLLPKLTNKNLINFDNLGFYFDELAKYSNNNFYSKDTIGIQSGYDLPEMEGVEKNGDYYYGYKRDNFGNIYYISVYRNYRGSLVIGTTNNIGLKIEDEDKVVSDYWSLLSPKAVQYSASVIDLFFKEAERLKDDPQFAKRESFFAQVIDAAKGIVSAITDTVKDIVSTVKDNAQIPDQNLLTSVSLDENNNTVQPSEQRVIGPSIAVPLAQNELVPNLPKDIASAQEQNLSKKIEKKVLTEKPKVEKIAEETKISIKKDSEQKIDKKTSSSTQDQLLNTPAQSDNFQKQNTQSLSTVAQICSFQTSKMPTYQKLLINELAWMGSVKSSSDEWIEVKNISGSELDISNWQVLDKEEQIKITFPENTKISAEGFLLLERTDDNSAPNVKADIIYTGAISNSNEALRLFDDKCGLIDEVFANSEWPAGEIGTKRTMERQADLGWWTYNGAGEGSGDALILGTPKKENMVKVVYYGGGGGGGGAVTSAVVETNNNSNAQPLKILISEIQITGGTGKTDNDFIELYNPNDSRVNLKGYRLVKRTKTGTTDTSIKSWTDDVYIESKGYYLWANSDYKDISILPNATTSASLANDNGAALRFGVEDTGTIIDSMAWGAAENVFIGAGVFLQNPGASQSIQRKFQDNTFIDTENNATDFEIQTCPSPKAQSRFCAVSETNKSNQAPSAFFDISTTTPKTGEEIIFNAASSTDSDGIIALYDWNYGNGVLATSTQATTTHSYLLAGNYSVSLTVFDNLNATSTYNLPLSVASSSIQENDLSQQASSTGHILISEIMPGMGTGNSDAEFIELYNPADNFIDLTNYELRRKSSVGATSTQILIKKENFAGKIIAAKGFLLIASPEHPASTTADIIYSQYSSPRRLAYDDDVVVLYNASSTIIDEVDYESIDEGKSLERMALSGGGCVSAQDEGEFLGNGCDSEGWEIRDIPNPQNSQNFIEPRSAPTAPQNFSAQYDKPNKKINLNWNESRDYSGATSTLSYLISDISANPVLSSITTSSTTVEFNISEIGRDYAFEIKAIDKEGLASDSRTVSINAAKTSVADINFLLINQQNYDGGNSVNVGQVFKPLADGILESLNMGLNTNGGGWAEMRAAIYEWNGNASSSISASRGARLAISGIKKIWGSTAYPNWSDYLWIFGGDVLLEAGKYYYLTVETESTSNSGPPYIYWKYSNGDYIDGDAWGDYGKVNDFYLVINAVKDGIISLQEPINSNIYYDQNINYKIKYLEPVDKKYSSITIRTSDFYTEELVDSRTIDLNDSEQTIGWHEISGSLGINRVSYFKTEADLSDSIKSEINFSVFGAVPAEGKLLNQTAFTNNISVNSVAQTFRPMISGQLDSITLKLSTSESGWNYISLKIYEWIGGKRNSLDGSRGQLLATSESKMFWHGTSYQNFNDFVWQFNDGNEINLDVNSYYYLESVIDSQSNGGAPTLYFAGSNNGSLIDGKLYSGNIGGDLYLILNKKAENPAL